MIRLYTSLLCAFRDVMTGCSLSGSQYFTLICCSETKPVRLPYEDQEV
jgi:hypothetical protein